MRFDVNESEPRSNVHYLGSSENMMNKWLRIYESHTFELRIKT